MRSNPVFIIGEAGVNHNGSIKLALELVDWAAEARVDAVKFQTFTPEKVISSKAPKADYQNQTTDSKESQLDMVRKLWLSPEDHLKIIDHCKTRGILFLSSPFDMDSIDLLADKFNVPKIKIPSGEITNAPYLLKVAQKNRDIILSTGMSNLGDIETALGVLAFGLTQITERPSFEGFSKAYRSRQGQEALKRHVALLHCTTEYPAPFEEINLRALHTLKSAFGLEVGYSDHTVGISIPIAAVALGATLIEKHFTTDKTLPGPDHRASLCPKELKEMVQGIREVEKAIGDGVKIPSPSEMKNQPIARKSLIAAGPVKAGEKWSETNLTIKRPGTGISPLQYWDILGTTAKKNYDLDDLV